MLRQDTPRAEKLDEVALVQPHARLRKQRLRLLAYLLQALIKLSRAVNLARLALDLPAKPSSTGDLIPNT
jgi:hypothetical protein